MVSVAVAVGHEQQALAQRWMEFVSGRDPVRREELILQYIPMVKYVVNRLGSRRSGVLDEDDALAAGTLGLLEAVNRFDPSAGVKFETFAFRRIRGAILDQVRALDWVPRSLRHRGHAIAETQARLEAEQGRKPSAAEVSGSLGLDSRQYRAARAGAATTVLSLEAPAGSGSAEFDDDRAVLAETIPSGSALDPAKVLEDAEVHQALVRGLRALSERERVLLSLYYERELTKKEIGSVLGVSEARVGQLHGRTLRRLRGGLDDVSGEAPTMRQGVPSGPLPAATANAPGSRATVATNIAWAMSKVLLTAGIVPAGTIAVAPQDGAWMVAGEAVFAR